MSDTIERREGRRAAVAAFLGAVLGLFLTELGRKGTGPAEHLIARTRPASRG